LQKLKDDVLRLEQIMQIAPKREKELFMKQTQKLERYSERIEKRLTVWIRRLEKLISEQEERLTIEDI